MTVLGRIITTLAILVAVVLALVLAPFWVAGFMVQGAVTAWRSGMSSFTSLERKLST